MTHAFRSTQSCPYLFDEKCERESNTMMRSKSIIFLSLSTLLLLATSCAPDNNSSFPTLTGDYFGQTPPGPEPELFAPGFITTGMPTRDVVITPDGNEIYYAISTPSHDFSTIVASYRIDGVWTKPEVAAFSSDSRWKWAEPMISPDGQHFFFVTTKPDPSSADDVERDDYDIWMMDRTDTGWSEPYNPGPPLNSPTNEFYPSVTSDGTVYFTRAGENRSESIFRCRLVDGQYQEAELLPSQVNCGSGRFNAFIAPDETYIIIPAFGLENTYGGVDHYISFRSEQDTWTEPLNMGNRVNSSNMNEWSATVTHDGKYLFFMSGRRPNFDDKAPLDYGRMLDMRNAPQNGQTDAYWMDASVIEDLRALAAGDSTAIVETSEPTGSTTDIIATTTSQKPWPQISGPYLGQTPPGNVPAVFAPGIVSTGWNDRDLIVSPDGTEIYFAMLDRAGVFVRVTRLVDGFWTRPEVPSFSTDPDFGCLEMALTPDNQEIHFLSTRPLPDEPDKPGWGNQNIFMSHRINDGWSEPEPAPGQVCTLDNEYYPSFTNDGTMYFTRSAGRANAAIWRSRRVDGVFAEPEQLPEQVNCAENSYNAFIAPDESYLIVCIGGKPENMSDVDYYVVFRDQNDQWSDAVNMGPLINSETSDAGSAYVSPDGLYLFFSAKHFEPTVFFPEGLMTIDGMQKACSSPENGGTDIYWVSTSILENMRPM
jgi:hypothetical protein